MTEEQELGVAQSKGELIRQAILIINKLAENAIADCDGCDSDDNSEAITIIQDLIIKSRTLKCNNWWGHLISK